MKATTEPQAVQKPPTSSFLTSKASESSVVPFIQPKLTVNEPGDAYKQQADAMAERVMRMSDPTQPLRTAPVHSLQRKCAHCEEDDKLQRKESGTTTPTAPASVHQTLTQSGQPLSAQSRAFFEPRFGQDFSGVRIHTDGSAAESARAINALAYTSGANVVFGSGQYQPESETGKRLLAHELTHVVQQRGALRSIQRVCSSAAVCRGPIPGSSTQFGDSELARERAGRRRRQAMTPSRSTSTSHAGLARQLEMFVNAQDPTLLTQVRGIFIDQDLSPGTGALTQSCTGWETEALPAGPHLPRTAGPASCIFVHGDLNQQALEFNKTANPTIGGVSRELWRVRTMQIFTHEVQHVLFDTAAQPTPAGITAPGCDFASVSHELSELNAIISEFPRIFRAIPAGAPASHPLNRELNAWFNRSATGGGEDIRGILTTMGCVCECADIEKWVRQTFAFVSSSWTPAERLAFTTTLKAKLPLWPL